MRLLTEARSLNDRLMQLLSSASAALQKPDIELSLNASRRTFGALLPSIPCTTARHNLATSFTRALSEPKLTTTRNSHSHHARPNLRPNVLCIRSTMSNSQRTSADFRPLTHSQFLLSQSPEQKMVGQGRFELPTSRLSSARSNQLSYKP